jgi:hypothetical protein
MNLSESTSLSAVLFTYPVLRVQQIPRIEHINATLSVNSVMANDFSAGGWEGDSVSSIFQTSKKTLHISS